MVFIWLQLQLRNAAEKPYLWCAQDVPLKKSASAEDGGPSSIHSISNNIHLNYMGPYPFNIHTV